MSEELRRAVVIVVEGGIVQAVFSDLAPTVLLIDWGGIGDCEDEVREVEVHPLSNIRDEEQAELLKIGYTVPGSNAADRLCEVLVDDKYEF